VRLRKTMTVLAVSGAAAFGVSACGGGDDDTTDTGASEDASVRFVEPMDGGTTGSDVTAKVELEGFTLDAEDVGGPNRKGQGHLHFSMDGGKYDYAKYSGANGELAKKLGVEGQYSPAVEPTITYKGLPAGEHTLTVDEVNNDHTETDVSATTTFTVKGNAASAGDAGAAAKDGGAAKDSGATAGASSGVDAVDFAFEPEDVTVEPGTTVAWTNNGMTTHTVKGNGFFSEAIDPGADYRYTFDKPGTYKYICTLHPDQMRGTVVVKG
jgi:plastocyanin